MNKITHEIMCKKFHLFMDCEFLPCGSLEYKIFAP